MQNSFEESIKKQLASFEITPKKAVWDEIEHSLDADNNRKKAILLWLTFGLLIIGMSYMGYNYFLTNNKLLKSQQVVKNTITERNPSKTKNTFLLTQKKEKEVSPKSIGMAMVLPSKSVANCNETQESNKAGITLKSSKLLDDYKKNTGFIKQIIIKHSQHVNENNALEKEYNNKNLLSEDKKKVSQTGIVHFSGGEFQEVGSTDSVHQIISFKTNKTQNESIATTKNDSCASKIDIDSSIIKQKIGRFFLMIGVGSMNVPIKSSNNSLVASATGSGSYTSITDVMSNNLPSKSGMALMLGITYQLDITKRWQFETGLNYLYLQNSQPVGLQRDSSKLSDNGHYYQAGSSTSLNNFAHLLQVPLRLKYVINPHSNAPFYLLFGGTIGYQLQSKWLVAENSNAILYYKKSLTKHLLSSGLIGFGVALKNKIGIDVTSEEAITPLQVNTYNKNLAKIITLNLSIPTELILNSRKTKNK